MKKFIYMFFVISIFLSFSYASSTVISMNDYDNFEKTHTKDERNENNNSDKDKDNSTNKIEDSLTPEELGDKDRTN